MMTISSTGICEGMLWNELGKKNGVHFLKS